MYELTSFLTTIAAASASIVAILGGFIASRLISLNSDRASAIEQLKQVNEELDLRKDQRDRLQKENDKYDAIDFIRDHVKELIHNRDLDEIYYEDNNSSLQLDELSNYWEEAIKIFDKYGSVYTSGSAHMNDDYVPEELAKEYTDDYFSYSVCKIIGGELLKEVREQEREEKRTRNGFLPEARNPFEDIDLDMQDLDYSDGYRYNKNDDEITKQNSEIMLLELQQKQIEDQRNSLQKPKGMLQGLIIFGLFSVVCIICPLAFIPYSTANLFYYHAVKYIFLILFSVGLIAIFIYLVYLLRWKDDEK